MAAANSKKVELNESRARDWLGSSGGGRGTAWGLYDTGHGGMIMGGMVWGGARARACQQQP